MLLRVHIVLRVDIVLRVRINVMSSSATINRVGSKRLFEVEPIIFVKLAQVTFIKLTNLSKKSKELKSIEYNARSKMR